MEKFAAELRIVVNYRRSYGIVLPGRAFPLGFPLNSFRGDEMETFLNLVWLIVALISIGLWRFRWAGSRRHPSHSSRMEAAAMVCFLALLFPVISLTDDLHPETTVVDAASGKRNAILIAASASHVRSATITPGSHVAAGTVVRPFLAGQLASLELIPRPAPQNFEWIARSTSGRSPPVLL